MKIILVCIFLIPIGVLAQVEVSRFNPERDGSNFYIRIGSSTTLAKHFLEELEISDSLIISNNDSMVFSKCYGYLKSEEIICETEAIELAEPHFSKRDRKSINPMLICDDDTNQILWKITRQTGFMNVTQESIIIDARTKNFLNREYYTYKRSFFMTIGDLFSGFY